MFVAMEAMADGGVKMGLSRQMAIKFAAQTMLVGHASLSSSNSLLNLVTSSLSPPPTMTDSCRVWTISLPLAASSVTEACF